MSEKIPSELAAGLQVLFPEPCTAPLTGLYLGEDLRALVPRGGAYVYTNFITSLDGRIALAGAETGQLEVPGCLSNPRDWRLLLELAAPADAIILSGRYLAQLAQDPSLSGPPFSGEAPSDLLAFREHNGLPPQPALVIVSRTADLRARALERLADRRLLLATVDELPAETEQDLRAAGVEVLRLGSRSVDGGRLVAALGERGLGLLYSIAGPEVLHLLLRAGVVQRLYLTTVLRVLAGDAYSTMVQGPLLDPPSDFRLRALYLDGRGPDGVEQLLQVYERREDAS